MLSKTEIWFENAPVGQRVRLVELPHETGGRRAVLESMRRRISRPCRAWCSERFLACSRASRA